MASKNKFKMTSQMVFNERYHSKWRHKNGVLIKIQNGVTKWRPRINSKWYLMNATK